MREAASMERRTEERSGCGGLLQQGRERVRALDGGWAAGAETGRATPSRNWIARAWGRVYILEGTSGLSGQNIP